MKAITQKTLRLFVAISLPRQTKQTLHCQAVLPLVAACGGRGTPAQNLHITVKFLGDVPEAAVREICEALSNAYADAAGCAVAAGGCGWFGRREAATAWLGLTRGEAAVVQLMRRCDEALTPLGYPPQPKGHQPHLTLARQVRAADMAALALPEFPFVVNNVTLMQSSRVQGRLTYTPLHTVALSVKGLR